MLRYCRMNKLSLCKFLHCRQREELLYQLKVVQTPPVSGKLSASDSPWILVDSDGEEDEDPANSWSHLQENDLVMLLNQFPLHFIFNHILAGSANDTDGQCICTRCVRKNIPLNFWS